MTGLQLKKILDSITEEELAKQVCFDDFDIVETEEGDIVLPLTEEEAYEELEGFKVIVDDNGEVSTETL